MFSFSFSALLTGGSLSLLAETDVTIVHEQMTQFISLCSETCEREVIYCLVNAGLMSLDETLCILVKTMTLNKSDSDASRF